MIHEQNLKQKSFGIVPLKIFLSLIQNVYLITLHASGNAADYLIFLSMLVMSYSGRSEESSLWRIRKIGEVPIQINFCVLHHLLFRRYLLGGRDQKRILQPFEFLGPY